MKYVSETGPKLKDQLSNLKYISVGSKFGHSNPCGQQSCQSCPLMSGNNEILGKNGKVKTAKGNCKTKNIIYGATCKLCVKNMLENRLNPAIKELTVIDIFKRNTAKIKI